MANDIKIEEALKQIQEKIQISREPAGLYDPVNYTLGMGGKMIRPRLCLLAYSLFKRAAFGDSIILPAAALEVFHNFTLLHDDIMDNADIRRGQPTVCRKWGDNTAILSGDVMCIESFKLISQAPAAVLPAVIDLFTTTAEQVCEGQQYDMDYESEPVISMEQYMHLIGLKTAVLIACAAKMGAIIAGASEQACDLLYKYGYSLGLAFQIADDYLDTFGDEKVFGKTIGGDIVQNKKSWLLTRAMEKSGELEKSGVIGQDLSTKALLDAMAMPTGTEEEKAAKVARVKAIYEGIGIDEDAKYEIIKFNESAMKYASLIGLGRVRLEVLHRFADALVGRTK